MLPRLSIPFFLFLILQTFTTVARGSAGDSSAPQPLTREEVRVYTGLLGAPTADVLESYRTNPNEGDRDDAGDYLRRAAREVVWSRKVAAEALKAGFEPPEAHVRTVRERYRDCVASAWLTAQADAATTLTLEQLKGVVQRHASLYRKPERREVRYLFMLVAEGADRKAEDQVRLGMEALRGEIESGRISFSSAAKQHSEAPSSKDGGLIGAVDRESGMNAQFLDLVFSTAAETMSPVTRLKNGYYLVRVEAIYAGRDVTDQQLSGDPALQQELLGRYRSDLVLELKSTCYKSHPQATSELDAVCSQAQKEGFAASECALRQQLELDRLRAYYYYASLHEKEWKPTEEEIRRYYEDHPAEMKEGGCFILTKLFVPVFAADRSTIRSRAQARDVAQQARQALIDGSTTETLTMRFAPAGLQVLNHKDWVMGTGDRATDLELLQSGPGFVSGISSSDEGVSFFILHERRELPLLPLESRRAYIERNVEHLKKLKALERAQEDLVASAGGWERLLPE